MPAILRSPLWTWVKVVLCIVALDWFLFAHGTFWALVPRLQTDPTTTGLVYESIYRTTARWPRQVAFGVGSSVMPLGLQRDKVRTGLNLAHVGSDFSQLTMWGASGLDSALLSHRAIDGGGWLVVFGLAARDFRRDAPRDTPVTRVLLDGSADCAACRPRDVEDRLTQQVRGVWSLYRYRDFVRIALLEWWARERLAWSSAWQTWRTPTVPASTPPTGSLVPLPPPGPPAGVPSEALDWFLPARIDAASWAAWRRWRDSGRFADFSGYLDRTGSHAIEQFRELSAADYPADDNPQVDAIGWAIDELHAHGIRVLVVFFPENPLVHAAEANAAAANAASDALAERLRTETERRDARFVDLRTLLPPEDFYDLIHPNVHGATTLSARVVTLIGEEWKAAGR